MIMVGLDAAGKTTVLYKIKFNEVMNPIPTIGFNVETVQYKNVTFNVWDIGGQDKIRKLWRHYFENNQGVIFVVDSSDLDRIDQAKEELHKLLYEDALRDCAVLVYANKQDLPNAMDAATLTERLELRQLPQPQSRKWYVQPCVALSGAGLYEGLDWLSKAVC